MNSNSATTHSSFEFCVKFDAVPTNIEKAETVSALPISFNGGPTWMLKYFVSSKNKVVFFLEFEGPIWSDFKVSLFINLFECKSLPSIFLKTVPRMIAGRTNDIEYWVEKSENPSAMYSLMERTDYIFCRPFTVRVSVVYLGMHKISNLHSPKQVNTDVILICGSEQLSVHSAILQARAPILHRLWLDIRNKNSETVQTVTIANFSPDVLKHYVYFLYAERENSSVDLSQLKRPFFPEMENYQLSKLINHCIEKLCSTVCEQNWCNVMSFAEKWYIRKLSEKITECICKIDNSFKAQLERKRNPPAVDKDLELATALYCKIFEYAYYLM